MSEISKVIIRSCPDYDEPARIREIVRQGMTDLASKPHGRVLLKYNMVFAHRKIARGAFTNPNVLEALIDVLGSMPEVDSIRPADRAQEALP